MVVSKTFRVCLGLALLIAALFCGRPLSAQVLPITQPIPPADYRISVGDVLEVWVYQHPELSRRVVVRSDGNHTLTVNGGSVAHLSKMDAIAHDLKVVDLSALDVAALVRAKLESIIPKPEVNVFLIEFIMQPSPINPPQQLRDVPSPKSRQDCCVVPQEVTPGAIAIDTYRIGIGDYIKVEVDGHPGISKRWSTVNQNGYVAIPSTYTMKASAVSIIDFQPFAFCVVKASSLTIQDFVDGLKHKLEVIIPNPQLRVSVRPASFGMPGPLLWDAPSPKCCVT